MYGVTTENDGNIMNMTFSGILRALSSRAHALLHTIQNNKYFLKPCDIDLQIQDFMNEILKTMKLMQHFSASLNKSLEFRMVLKCMNAFLQY